MIFARNNVIVENDNFTDLRTYNLDAGVRAHKLSVQALSATPDNQFIYGPVIVQITEGREHTYEDELNSQMFLELGFNSRGFATPITGARFRVPDMSEVDEVKPAKLHFVFYG